MKENLPVPQKISALLIGIIAWMAVILQFYLALHNRQVSIVNAVIRFFSYFTILCNIFVGLCFLAIAFYKSKNRGYFLRPKVIAAITVYILIVGITYNVNLRFTWDPQGLQRVVDECLHSIVPAICLLYWIIFAGKKGFKWADFVPWMAFPFLYCVYILIRGAIGENYPYPFMDVAKYGYPQVLINCIVILVLFLVLSLALIGVAKLFSKTATRSLKSKKG